MEEYPIRCRLICASNESARELLQGKLMRQDLFYRISDFILAIPPLRERREDILELAKRFICQYNREFHKNITGMSDRLQDWLQAGCWKGNTRELERVMRSLMLRVPEVESELDLQKDIESLLGLEHTAVRRNRLIWRPRTFRRPCGRFRQRSFPIVWSETTGIFPRQPEI